MDGFRLVISERGNYYFVGYLTRRSSIMIHIVFGRFEGCTGVVASEWFHAAGI